MEAVCRSIYTITFHTFMASTAIPGYAFLPLSNPLFATALALLLAIPLALWLRPAAQATPHTSSHLTPSHSAMVRCHLPRRLRWLTLTPVARTHQEPREGHHSRVPRGHWSKVRLCTAVRTA